jgi:hypothetical protein
MSKIIVHLEGGLVQDVYLTGKGKVTEAVVMDFDTEGADPDEITAVITKDENVAEACIHTEAISRLPRDSNLDRLLKEYLK